MPAFTKLWKSSLTAGFFPPDTVRPAVSTEVKHSHIQADLELHVSGKSGSVIFILCRALMLIWALTYMYMCADM